MLKKFALGLAAVVLALGLYQPTAQAECSRTSTGGILGALGGAAAGGLIGSQFGGGTGQLIATGGGVFVGALLGNELGRELDCNDQQAVVNTTQNTLETQPTGTTVAWNNPDSGNQGTVTPTQTYQRDDGIYCREFQQTIVVDGKTETGYGTACRQPDGTWQIQN